MPLMPPGTQPVFSSGMHRNLYDQAQQTSFCSSCHNQPVSVKIGLNHHDCSMLCNYSHSYDASLFRIQGDFGKLIDDLIQKCYYENNPYDE